METTIKLLLIIFWGALILIFWMIVIAIFVAVTNKISKVKFFILSVFKGAVEKIAKLKLQISSFFKAKRVEISGKIIFLTSKDVEYPIVSFPADYSLEFYSPMVVRGKEFLALIKNDLSGEVQSVVLPDKEFYEKALAKKEKNEPVKWLCSKFLWDLFLEEEEPVNEINFST